MSRAARATRRGRSAAAAFVVAFLPFLPVPVGAATADDTAPVPRQAASVDEARTRTMLIVRVLVNTVSKGDIAVLRDAQGRLLVPLADVASWGLSVGGAAPVVVGSEPYVDVSAVPGLDAKFDAATVTLDLRVAAGALPPTTLDLGPGRRTGTIYPAETGFFVNYGFNATGDDAFDARQYQLATEVGARTGNWLFYGTTTQEWGNGAQNGFVRLITNAQYDERPNLRRYTFGDFFTPAVDLNGSVPMAGASLTKLYAMDPYFVQYPTAAFATELAFPSTVQVRIDGNLIAQRQVPPGPLRITNITNGLTGGQNVSVVVRDPFGREQSLQQPFFFATNVGLARGLHEYSYSAGFVRRQYGVESSDYGGFAASASHRYAFTNQLTLGLRGQAAEGLYNVGPFGTYQSPLGIVGIGAGIGGRGGGSAAAGTAAYSYTGASFSVNLGALYRAREYAQLTDLTGNFRIRTNQYASGSLYFPAWGTLTATYNGLASYDGPDAKVANVTYTRSVLDGKGLLSVNYVRTVEPQSTYAWLLSLRYFFDGTTSVVAAAGGSSVGNTQALALQKSVPQGEGMGYELDAGRFAGDAPDSAFGRAFAQVNAAHATLGGEYARASRPEGGPGLARVFVAGSIGSVGGRLFAARPVQDSFALVRVADLAGVPVYANGWFVGRTDASGEVVATNIASYYDNTLSFDSRELSWDLAFGASEIVISPPTRSGTLVAFAVRWNRAIVGRLVEMRDGTSAPLEFREITLSRGDSAIRSFTARRGEFYVEGVDPGEYLLRQETGAACTARIVVPELEGAMTDIGAVVCQPSGR